MVGATAPGVKTLGALVAGFKSSSTTQINNTKQTSGSPLGQRNYHKRVIRNHRELNAIREYIQPNPLNWELDSKYSVNRKL